MSERVKQFEEELKKRYNRNVEVRIEQTVDGKKLKKVRGEIKYKDKEYIIEEYLDEKQLTAYCYVEVDGKTHKYKRYIDAEVFIADCIGEQDG